MTDKKNKTKPTKEELLKVLEKGPPEEDLPICFTIMPFHSPFKPMYWDDIYKPAIEKAGMQAQYGEIFRPGVFMEQVWELIQAAKVILAELTPENPKRGLNANVFYELGLAHSLGKPTVLIGQDIEYIPADIRHQRIIIYDTADTQWVETLRNKITKFISESLDDPIRAIPKSFRNISEVQPEKHEVSLLENRILALEQAMDANIHPGRYVKNKYTKLANLLNIGLDQALLLENMGIVTPENLMKFINSNTPNTYKIGFERAKQAIEIMNSKY